VFILYFFCYQSPDDIFSSIDSLGTVLTSSVCQLNELTGWAFTILSGGLDKDGEIKMATYLHSLAFLVQQLLTYGLVRT
jgi:hypothetical protein